MNVRSLTLGIVASASACALIGVCALCTAPAAAARASLPAQPLTAQLTAAVMRGDTPGVTALVVDRDGILYEGAAGKLDVGQNIPMPVNAIFNIASMTKPVTSVGIMMLLEQGKLKLDDPVSKYLSGFDNLQVITKFNEADGTYETRPAKRPMTIRHLLTHTSGIGYAFCNPIVARLQKATQKSEWELPLLSDPGDKWNYSASTRVLGLIVEKITGQTLEAFDQEQHLQAARHGRHVVCRGRRQAVAGPDAAQPRQRQAAGAAARADPVDADGALPRRWRPLFDRAATTGCSCACCSTAATWGPRKF